MRKVKVYVEGATRGRVSNQSAKIALRRGFKNLAERLNLANEPEFVACGGRTQTWDAAWQSFLRKSPDEDILLLVDSEEPTAHAPQEAWRHLKMRDGWSDLQKRHSRHVFMMVTTMETWIVVDSEALKTKFKEDFRANAIPKWPEPETVAKDDVLAALGTSTSGKYAKGMISFELVGLLDPETVAAKCPHARYFFESLKQFCGAATR